MTGYERRDIRLAPIAKAFGVLSVVAALVALASEAGLLVFSGRVPASARRSFSPPPEPRLQADPAGELRRMREREDAELDGYGWTDRSRGAIRIPIARAMSLLLRRGLPTRSSPGEARP